MSIKYKNIHQELIDRCVTNDKQAQFEIYKLYYKAMYNTSLRIVPNKTDAEDVMQEAFLNAFKKIKTYSREVSFGSWLKKIVVNRSIDYLKKNKIQTEDIEKNTYRISNKVVNGNHSQEEVSFKAEKIKRAIASLPYGYKNVVNLYLLEGYDHSEIGQIMNISEQTSRTQFHRAKKKIVKIMQQS